MKHTTSIEVNDANVTCTEEERKDAYTLGACCNLIISKVWQIMFAFIWLVPVVVYTTTTTTITIIEINLDATALFAYDPLWPIMAVAALPLFS